MNKKTSFLIFFLLVGKSIFGQTQPEIDIKFSKLYATYEFAQKLSETYPDNTYKDKFQKSKFNTEQYTSLINQLDTLNIYETYEFQGYPSGQKIPGSTTNILKKNLILNNNLEDFKKQSFAIVPTSELFAFTNILEKLELVYDSLIYFPKKEVFDEKVNQLSKFVEKSKTAEYFETGLKFYNTKWDNSVPFEIVIVPSINQRGFTATAFLNIAVSEVQVEFDDYDILLSVLMHEIYHILYDEQSLEFKLAINKWFNQNPSKNSQYAYLLLNEVLATAIGNGYVYEQLNGKLSDEDWYNVKYINQMAKKIYPIVKEYLSEQKPMDKEFIDAYISIYDAHFSEWLTELDNLLAYRYIIADNPKDFDFFLKNYPRTTVSYMNDNLNLNGLERMKEKPITKIVIITKENSKKLEMVKNTFPELNSWIYNPKKEFIHTEDLEDKTKIIIVNSISTVPEKLLEQTFKNRKVE